MKRAEVYPKHKLEAIHEKVRGLSWMEVGDHPWKSSRVILNGSWESSMKRFKVYPKQKLRAIYEGVRGLSWEVENHLWKGWKIYPKQKLRTIYKKLQSLSWKGLRILQNYDPQLRHLVAEMLEKSPVVRIGILRGFKISCGFNKLRIELENLIDIVISIRVWSGGRILFLDLGLKSVIPRWWAFYISDSRIHNPTIEWKLCRKDPSICRLEFIHKNP